MLLILRKNVQRAIGVSPHSIQLGRWIRRWSRHGFWLAWNGVHSRLDSAKVVGHLTWLEILDHRLAHHCRLAHHRRLTQCDRIGRQELILTCRTRFTRVLIPGPETPTRRAAAAKRQESQTEDLNRWRVTHGYVSDIWRQHPCDETTWSSWLIQFRFAGPIGSKTR